MKKYQYDTNFISWFIGFFEGDGCFVMKLNSSHKRFEIWQSFADVQVLHYIRSTLQFGVVTKLEYRPDMATYVASGPVPFNALQPIFYNNLCSENSRRRYSHFYSSDPGSLRFPSFNDAWLSGFIDAEGSFRVKVEEDGRTRTVFSISQRDKALIYHIKSLFKGLKENRNIYELDGLYTLELSGKKEKLLIINYLERFPLRSHKRIVLLKWKKIFDLSNRWNKEDQITKRESILKLSENLNQWRRKEKLKIESDLHRDM